MPKFDRSITLRVFNTYHFAHTLFLMCKKILNLFINTTYIFLCDFLKFIFTFFIMLIGKHTGIVLPSSPMIFWCNFENDKIRFHVWMNRILFKFYTFMWKSIVTFFFICEIWNYANKWLLKEVNVKWVMKYMYVYESVLNEQIQVFTFRTSGFVCDILPYSIKSETFYPWHKWRGAEARVVYSYTKWI